MLENFDKILYKLRYAVIGVLAVAVLLLLSVLAATVKTSAAKSPATSDPTISTSSVFDIQAGDDSNAVTVGLASAVNQISQSAGKTSAALTNSLSTVGSLVSDSGALVVHTSQSAAHAAGTGMTATGHALGTGASAAVHGVGSGIVFVLKVPVNVLGFMSHAPGVSAAIHPKDDTPTPTITQMRATQAALIESGTQEVAVAAAPVAAAAAAAVSVASGAGGACDNAAGNGGYPMVWCNAPMDTLATIPYSSDRINRECTSYAYWYFTAIEGHGDFKVYGDAKYWTDSSNYPTHADPRVGAIGVETAGTYGHVVIIQALAGQTFDGQVVPSGDVLVSEMNYDWHGHFRYSFSPLSKFAGYIYP